MALKFKNGINTTKVEFTDNTVQTTATLPTYIQETQPTHTGPYVWIELLPSGNRRVWVNT